MNATEEKDADIFPCAHCQGSGTCSTGENGQSCDFCIKEAKANKNAKGVVCGVCGGVGIAELKTDRINKRTTSILAILIAYFALALVLLFGLIKSEFFSETLAFSGTLIGSITGYYFSGKGQKN